MLVDAKYMHRCMFMGVICETPTIKVIVCYVPVTSIFLGRRIITIQ